MKRMNNRLRRNTSLVVVLALFLAMTPGFFAQQVVNVPIVDTTSVRIPMPSMRGTGSSQWYDVGQYGVYDHVLTANINGSVSALTIALQCSNDGSTVLSTIGTSSAITGVRIVGGGSCNYVRATISAYTGTGRVVPTWTGYVDAGTVAGTLAVQGISGGQALDVNMAQIDGIAVASGAIPVTNLNGLPLSVSVSGTPAVTATVTQGTASNLKAQIVGAGTAGTADANPVTIQGISSGVPVSVSPAPGVTFPVSLTSGTVTANAGTNLNTSALALESGGNLATVASTLGAKTDAKSTATDATSVSAMQVLKEISASVQAPPSQAVTNAGTFATQATLAAETSKVIGTVNVAAAQTIAVTNAGTFATQATLAAETTKVIGTVNVAASQTVGLAAGSAVVGVVGNAQASTTSGQSGPLVQGAVTTSAPSYTNAQTSPLSLDTSGSLRVNVVSGSTGNAAASNTGSTVPTQAGYDGINVGGTLRGLTGSNPSGSIYSAQMDMVAIAGTAIAPGAIPVTTPTGQPLNVSVVSGSTGNAAASATGSAVPSSADYNGINVSGTLRGRTGVNPTGSVYAAQTDVSSINGTAISGTSIPVSQATASNLKAQVIGAGTAGTPDSNPVTIQGITGGTPIPTTFIGPAMMYQIALPGYSTPFVAGMATSAGMFTIAMMNTTVAVSTAIVATSITLANLCSTATSFYMTDGNGKSYTGAFYQVPIGGNGVYAVYPGAGQLFAGGIKVSAGAINCINMQVNGWVP